MTSTDIAGSAAAAPPNGQVTARLPLQVAGIKRMLDEKNLDELRRAVSGARELV